MNRNILKAILREREISMDNVSLDGVLKNDCHVISEFQGRWDVFYFERGVRFYEKEFSSEEEACRYLLRLLTQ